MARFKVSISAGAEADLLAIPFPMRRQLNQRILKLADEPRPADHETVGTAGDAAIVMHGYGLYYSVDDEASLVTVIAIVPEGRG